MDVGRIIMPIPQASHLFGAGTVLQLFSSLYLDMASSEDCSKLVSPTLGWAIKNTAFDANK